MINAIALAIAVGVYIFFSRGDKSRMKRAFTAYYAEKRKQFPYVEDWIQKNGDPSEHLSKNDTGGCVSKILYCVISLIAVIIPSSFKELIASAVLIGIAYLICEFVARRKAKKPGDFYFGSEPGLTLECPKCHCPNSWGLFKKETKYLSKRNEKTSSSDITIFSTKVWRDYKCLNCGHSDVVERLEDERGKNWDDQPEDRIKEFDPPILACNYSIN